MSLQETILTDLYTEEIYNITGGTMVVINKPWTELTQDDMVLLTKILTAVKLSIPAVHILHLDHVAIDQLMLRKPDNVLIFGADVTPPLPHYELSRHGSTRVIVSEELSRLDDSTKKKLWANLKEMFKP